MWAPTSLAYFISSGGGGGVDLLICSRLIQIKQMKVFNC